MSKELAVCGTLASYRLGCRCDDCRAANTERVRKQVRAKGIKPVQLAPCGTKAAKNRHRRNGETCDVCANAGGRKIHPCGTWQSRRRHARNGETCDVCDAIKAAPKTPTPKPNKPKQLKPCGTPAAARRHRLHNEPVCDTCKQADRDRAEKIRRQAGIPKRLTNQDFIEELTFLINAGEGQHRILTALGYQGRENALHQRLYRTNRHDLAQQIFGWDLAA